MGALTEFTSYADAQRPIDTAEVGVVLANYPDAAAPYMPQTGT